MTEFFGQLSRTTTFEKFEPKEFVAQGDKGVALGQYTARTTNGGRVDSEWVMILTVRNGKIVAFKEFSDSAQLNAAYA